MADRILPYDGEAEVAILGGILLRPELIDEVADVLTPQDFHIGKHAVVFEEMQGIESRGDPLDSITLGRLLVHRQEIDGAEALHIINRLNGIATAAGTVGHAKRVAGLARQRRVILAAQRVVDIGYEHHKDPDAYCDDAESTILSASAHVNHDDAMPMSTIIHQTVEWLEDLKANRVEAFGVPTGYNQLDDWLCGFQPAGLYIVAGPPKTGKTSWCLDVALRAKIPAAVFSLEQSRKQLALRAISGHTGVPYHRLVNPRYWDKDTGRLIADAASELFKCPLFIDDRSALTPMQIKARSRRLKKAHGIKMVLVDYLGIAKPTSSKANQSRERDVASMTAEFKALAKDLDLPVILLSQLNRQGTGGDRPKLNQLRDSGAVEQDSDAVIFLHRPDKANVEKATENAQEAAEIVVAANRNGPTGIINVTWDPVRFRFIDEVRRANDPLAAVVRGGATKSGDRFENNDEGQDDIF